ncbi:MAG TPA: alpha/beta fold hydrolase [Candidatus Hydrogenedentes bacterium]|nr:alpha/beta fold hydrolase [Candidatus Hydrogenedentota bacterium]HOS01493.1 alpha/beta fold hydrolase [Candidatus Hydrogenedentota bacterium]
MIIHPPLHVKQYGQGHRAWLGIHGWAGNHRTFRPLASHVPNDCVLYSADLPGYGLTPPLDRWALDPVVAMISETLRRLPHRSLTLVGYCGGGNLAMLAAQQAPERVERLVLIDPFAYMPLYFRVFTWGSFGRRAYMSAFANPLGRRIANAVLRRKRRGHTDLTETFGRVNHALTIEVMRSLLDFPPLASFQTLSMPIDMAYGERTFAAVKRSVQIWKTVWPHARAQVLLGAAHNPIAETPAQTAAILFDEAAPRAGIPAPLEASP